MNVENGIDWEKPDQLRNVDRKNIFFLIRGVVTQNLSNFSPEQVTCPKKQELFSQRGKLLLAPPGLNPKPHACESKNFPRKR